MFEKCLSSFPNETKSELLDVESLTRLAVLAGVAGGAGARVVDGLPVPAERVRALAAVLARVRQAHCSSFQLRLRLETQLT